MNSEPRAEIYIGIDIGTSSTKVVAADERAQPICHAGRPYPMHAPEPGYAEQDAEEIFEAVVDGLREVVLRCNATGNIRAVGLSCAMHGVLLLDANHEPLYPIVTWADMRSEAVAAELKDSAAGREIYARTGTPIHPMSPLCKLIWFRRHRPELLARAAKIVSIKEYIVYRLTGDFVIDHSIASATGLFDIFTRTWHAPALETAGITPDQLSKPVSTTSLLPPLSTHYTALLNLPSDTPWVIGASDGCLANLGVHADTPSRAALTIGTSGAIRVTTAEPRIDEKRRLFTYILDDTRYVAGGAISNGGISLKWFQEHLMAQSDSIAIEQRLQETASIRPGSEGLICLPYLLGERAPHWNSFDRGVFFGVQFHHTGVHFLKAMLEGICLTLYFIGKAIEETCGPFDCLLANGGVLQSPEWLQMLADVFGKDVVVTPAEDASAMGAILLAMQALGTEKAVRGFDSQQSDENRIRPDPAAHAAYQRIAPVFSDLYDKLQADFHRLQSI